MWETCLGTLRFFLTSSDSYEARLLCLAGIKHLLILSYKLVERLTTMVMAFSIGLTILSAQPTYSDSASVNTIATTTEPAVATTTAIEIEEITLTNTAGNEVVAQHTAGTTKVSAVVRQPRLVAQQGESQEVIDAILQTFPEEPVMVEVARCESSLDPSRDRKGIDGGLFQINQIHLPTLANLGLDRYDLHDNLTYSRILYDQSGLGPWDMSRYCWGKYT